MSETALHLILDQGGSRSRALIIDDLGHVIARASESVATTRPRTGWVEQSPDRLVCSLRQAAERALSLLPPAELQRLKDCGLVCQRSNLLIADADKPLTEALSWQDSRGADRMPTDPARIEQIRQRSGLYPSAHHGASKFAWLLEKHAAVRACAPDRLRLLPLGAFLIHALTGCHGVDPGIAQRTLLFNATHCTWDSTLCGQFGIDPARLPNVRPSVGDWGRLQLSRRSLPCRLLAGDQAVAPLSEGALAAGCVQITLGSGAFLIAHMPNQTAPHRLLESIAWRDKNRTQRWLEGSVNGAASALQRLELALPEQPATRPALFLNAEGGLAAPYWRTDLSSRLLGGGQQDAATAVAESWLFLLLENLNAMKNAGVSMTHLRLGGGLLRPWLAQALADLSRLPVQTLRERETTARGAAWLLADQPTDWQQAPINTYLPTTDASLHNRYRRWHRALRYWLQR